MFTTNESWWALAAGLLPCAPLLLVMGCATPESSVLIDPLKQRLLAREDVALQNLLFARLPAYPADGPRSSTSSSYLDAPYDGPAIEPPLPDLNMLPEDIPPWEEVPSTSGGMDAAPINIPEATMPAQP